MVYVFFLLSKKLGADRIQRVASQLMISLHELEKIELKSTVGIGCFRVSVAHLLAGKVCVLCLRYHTLQPRPIGETGAFQMLCPIEQIWKVEVGYVVSDDDVRIHLFYKVPPSHQHLLFCIELEDLRVDDQTTRVKTENVADKRFRLSVSRYDICNLDDWVLVCFWKDTLAACAFNVEGKDPKRRHLRPFSVVMMCNEISIMYVCLDLAVGVAIPVWDHVVFAWQY